MKFIKFIILLFYLNLFSEGFYQAALVKTVNGDTKIADLKVGDEVLGYDFKAKEVAIQKVIKISEIKSDRCCALNLFDKNIFVHTDQLIYLNPNWIKVSELSQEVFKEEIKLYRITTYPDHNFFIENNILVHNFAPAVLLKAALESPAIIQAAGTILAGIVTWFGSKKIANTIDSDAIARNKRAKNREQKRVKSGSSFLPNPEDPEEEFKKKYPNGKYENAPYHHNNSRGPKGRAPIDGQRALDNSFLVKEKGNQFYQRRIGISNNQFVVLDETGNKVFHGHVRPWDELSRPMKSELIRSKLVSHSGKIV